jgi:hypothetical protein
MVVAVAGAVDDEAADGAADAEVDEKTDARSTNAHSAKWTTIPTKHAERESMMKTTQTPVIHTPAVQTPPGMTNILATTAVS